ncbi:MAG: hypothetical protein H8E66_30890 [Planctomycetes bacterium]|nr:hypothetical protein [Planctomycetota bacterium]
MHDSLDYIWPHIEYCDPIFEESLVRSWNDDAFEKLRRSGVLEQAEATDYFACPYCEDTYLEEIIAWETPAGIQRLAIPCHEHGRVILSPEQLRQWSVSFDRLVYLLAAGLGIAGEAVQIEPWRLWRLGKINWQGGLRDVLFTRGFDARCAISSPPDLSRYPNAIVLLPHAETSRVKWEHHVPTVVSLPEVATLRADGIEFDHSIMLPMIAEADAIARVASESRLNMQDLKLIISREVKSIQTHELTDEILVRAYIQEGSFRKAAEFLSRETGQEITKDKVHRAVQRSGGTTALARGEDSDSIVRTVASQRRDRTKKIQRRPEDKQDK